MASHGKNLYIAVDDVGGALRNLSTFVRGVDGLPIAESAVSDATAAGTSVRTFVRGQRTSTFTIEGLWDKLVTTGPDVVLSGLLDTEVATDFVYGPNGNTSGSVTYSGTAFLTAYTVSSPYDDVVTFSATFQVNSAVVRAVVV